MITFNEIQGCVFYPQGPKEIANIQIVDQITHYNVFFVSCFIIHLIQFVLRACEMQIDYLVDFHRIRGEIILYNSNIIRLYKLQMILKNISILICKSSTQHTRYPNKLQPKLVMHCGYTAKGWSQFSQSGMIYSFLD